MNIVIVVKHAFPYGGAEMNRIISYAKWIVAKGHKVNVLCLQPTEKEGSVLNKESRGTFEGIDFIYPAGTTIWPDKGRSYLRKIYLWTKSYLNTARIIYKNRKSISVVMAYSAEIKLFNYLNRVCKPLHIPTVVERSEYPDIFKHREDLEKTAKGRKYIAESEDAFKKFDGWILETQTLANFYMPLAKKDAKLCIIPMTVESERFSNVAKQESKYGKYIGYCGNMRDYDGVSILIEAFGLIAQLFPDVNLALVGSSPDMEGQKKLVDKLGIQDRVFFAGRLKRDEVPSFLANATVLALASPTSDRACASMPCKVGEYLCTEVPVVVTSLGELPKYLTDGVDSYLSAPDSAEAFAARLSEVLSDPSKAEAVGKEGRVTAMREFDGEMQAERIIHFFEELTCV
jgi:glycosyltransferase involved in cell wall biosynthesis